MAGPEYMAHQSIIAHGIAHWHIHYPVQNSMGTRAPEAENKNGTDDLGAVCGRGCRTQ
jgi:hypothetical protein